MKNNPTTDRDDLPKSPIPYQEHLPAAMLNGPSISGSVRVPLAELDKLRSDHVQAIRLAKDLESKQMQVKVIVLEQFKYHETHYGESNGIGVPRYSWVSQETGHRQLSIEYKGLDEARSILRQEEKRSIQGEIDQLELDVKVLKDSVKLRDAGSIELNKELAEVKKERDALKTQAALDLTIIKEVETLRDNIKTAEKNVSAEKAMNYFWKREKSFWFWLRTTFMEKYQNPKTTK